MTEPSKRTPLYEKQKARGARFSGSSEFHLPQNYGDPFAESRNARKNVAVVDISNRSKIVVSGRDRIKFLQGMLTNDVKEKVAGTGAYATLLTPKGKMISDMRIFVREHSVYMDIEPCAGSEVVRVLTRFKLSYKIELSDVTEKYCVLHVCGPDSSEFLESRLGVKTVEMDEYDHTCSDDRRLTVFKINRTGETGFDVLLENHNSLAVWDLLTLDDRDCAYLFGLDSLETLRIEAGIPIYGKDMDSSTIPIEAGIWNALDFEKGCYVGQEVIARIRWRGRVNWHLACFAAKEGTDMFPGDELSVDGKKVGRITSSAYSPLCGKNIALGYVRKEFRDFTDELAVRRKTGDEISSDKVKILGKPVWNHFK